MSTTYTHRGIHIREPQSPVQFEIARDELLRYVDATAHDIGPPFRWRQDAAHPTATPEED